MSEPVIFFDITSLVNDLQQVSELSNDQITANVLNDIGQEIALQAKSNAPVKSGALRNSITYFVQDGKLTIEADVPYSMFVEFGTGTRGEWPGSAYTIRPKNAKVLAFQVGNKMVFTKKVTHPGIKAKPYLRPAAIEVMGPLLTKLADRGQALILKGPNSDIA